jgi:hypothetical protein
MILNLTLHSPTPEQAVAGVTEPVIAPELMTFTSLPTPTELAERAAKIAELATEAWVECEGDCEQSPFRAMIGGAPFFMAPLEAALEDAGFRVVYAFSVRESAETVLPDGSVRKTNVFRHVGFIDAASLQAAKQANQEA